ncbi:ataxin-2 homolog [Haliotis rubra]|uniref:ataxin-2 homolog n=1 Tax=Haliotis rubra TaxID=36100 RepID=UPI001EE5B1F0|nr:ataxin-2 homolog [Haliotis rubra]
MEDGQSQMTNSDIEILGCTPPECRTDSGGNTSSGMKDVEHRDVYEENWGEFGDDTDEEEGDGIQDMSQLGAGAIAVKLQTVHQQSYQLVGKDTKSLAQQILGRCQQPQGEVSTAPQQQQQQLQPASGGDANERTGQGHLSTSTTGVAPGITSLQVPRTAALTLASTGTTSPLVAPGTTSPRVPGTAALTAESTSSLLPRIQGSLVSQIQSSGMPEVPITGDSPAVTQYNFIQVQQQFGDVTVKGGKNLNIGGTQNVGTTPTKQEEEEKPLTATQKIRKRTASRIESWTEDMVETDTFKKVKEKLDRGATWVTIKGRPGEGEVHNRLHGSQRPVQSGETSIPSGVTR